MRETIATDTGWDAGTQASGMTYWYRGWLDAAGETVRFATVFADERQPGYFFTDCPVAHASLAAAKRYATSHPHYPGV